MFDSVTSRILLDSTRTIRPWNLQRPSGFLMEYESMGMGVPSAGLFLSPFCQAQRVDRRIVRYKMIGLYLLDNWWLCEWGLVGLRFFEDSLNFELALRWEIWSWNFLDPRNRKKLCKQAWFPALILSLRWQKIPLNQWPCNRNPNWRYLAYIFGLCFMAKFQGISPQFLCPKIKTYLHVVGSWRSPIDFLRPDDGCFFLKTWQIQQMCHGDHEEPTDLEWFHGDLSTNVGF